MITIVQPGAAACVRAKRQIGKLFRFEWTAAGAAAGSFHRDAVHERSSRLRPRCSTSGGARAPAGAGVSPGFNRDCRSGAHDDPAGARAASLAWDGRPSPSEAGSAQGWTSPNFTACSVQDRADPDVIRGELARLAVLAGALPNWQ